MNITPEQLDRMRPFLHNYNWRINNLYKIRDVTGNAIPFRLNWAQEDFKDACWYFNLILKARQLGFSTYIDLHGLDRCVFHKNQSFGIIAQGEKEAFALLDNCRFAYNNLPAEIKACVVLTKDNTETMEFSNGSRIVAGISLRSGTYQILHVSEFGKTSAKFPDKAREIKTGALNTVHSGQQIFVESTAEGQAGEFYDLTQTARKLEDSRALLTPLDPKFHFYAWWKHPDYALSLEDAARTIITPEDHKYFQELQHDNIMLSPEQMAWYIKKKQTMGEDMWREFPSTPDEAFKASVAGAIYAREMRLLRRGGRITSVPYDPKYPVHTFWDFGSANYMAIWFFQHVGREKRMIRFYQNTEAGFPHYISYMKELEYNYGNHYVPHDGATTRMMETGNKTYKQLMETLELRNIKIIPVTKSRWKDIEFVCKPALQELWIDEKNCADGIKCLDNYKKIQNKDGVWLDEPHHDQFSDGADAIRCYAMGYKQEIKAPPADFRMSGAMPL